MKKANFKNLAEVILNLLVIIMGIVVMSFPSFGLMNPVYYVGALFSIIAFFTAGAYFVYREENDYELLLSALISVITAIFLFAANKDDIPFVLGTGIMIYTLLTVLNKGYSILKLKKEPIYLIKLLIAFLIAFLGILTMINLYNELSVQTLMIGYYFISLGIMSLIEPSIYLFVNKDKLSQIIETISSEDEVKKEEVQKVEKIEEPKKVQPETTKKSVKTETKTVTKPKKTNTTKKKTTNTKQKTTNTKQKPKTTTEVKKNNKNATNKTTNVKAESKPKTVTKVAKPKATSDKKPNVKAENKSKTATKVAKPKSTNNKKTTRANTKEVKTKKPSAKTTTKTTKKVANKPKTVKKSTK